MNPPVQNQNPIPGAESAPVSELAAEVAKTQEVKVELPTNTIRSGGGINLVPLPTVQEVQTEERKGKFNVGGAFTVLLLVIFSLAIVGYNAYARITLSSKNAELKKVEKEIQAFSYAIKSNNEILDRYSLYQNVEDKTFSPKEVLVFWQDVSKGLGTVEGIELSEGLKFVIRGSAKNLTDVAKLWHFLSIDQRISRVNLDSMSVTDKGVQFSFAGDLNFDYFSAK